MNVSQQPGTTAHPLVVAKALRQFQPDSRAGTIYDRVNRRRPNDRRQHDRPVMFDMRVSKSERRNRRRRAIYDPGRRHWPEPPMGIDVWV